MWSGSKALRNPLGGLANPFLTTVTGFLSQQTRTTFVLKRKWPPGLHKKNQKPKPLSARHYVYDLVEDTNLRKHELLEVILTSYVEGVGERGDRVALKPNLAYNKLLLPGLARYASPQNVEKYENKTKDTSAKQMTYSSPYAQRTLNMLSTLTLAVVMSKDNPWTLERWHLKASFRKAGFHVAEDAITLPEKPITGPDTDKQGKEFYVTVTVNNTEQVKVRCRLHHWSTVPSDRVPYRGPHWRESVEPIFPEDKPVLDSLPKHPEAVETGNEISRTL